MWENEAHKDEKTIDFINNLDDELKEVRSIYALALPSDMLMFNIMRACIGIKDVKELWFKSSFENF